MVITVEIYKQIRKMRLEGKSQRQIAGELQISRNTVKKYWDGDSVPWERKDYSREATVLTDDVVSFVRKCLEDDARCRYRKQQHTAKRIYDRLVSEYGFTGGETTVRRLVQKLREKVQEALGGQSLWTAKIISQLRQNARRDSILGRKSEVP